MVSSLKIEFITERGRVTICNIHSILLYSAQLLSFVFMLAVLIAKMWFYLTPFCPKLHLLDDLNSSLVSRQWHLKIAFLNMGSLPPCDNEYGRMLIALSPEQEVMCSRCTTGEGSISADGDYRRSSLIRGFADNTATDKKEFKGKLVLLNNTNESKINPTVMTSLSPALCSPYLQSRVSRVKLQTSIIIITVNGTRHNYRGQFKGWKRWL